jgi:hypothetical protein
MAGSSRSSRRLRPARSPSASLCLSGPKPGGDVDGDLGWALTNSVWDFADTYGIAGGGDAWWIRPFADIPVPVIIVLLVTILVWVPFRAR